MNDFEKQLLILILDKGLLALVIAILGFYAKRYLDRLSSQNAYRQKLAEERLRAYKDISRVIAHQLNLMGRVPAPLMRLRDNELHNGGSTQEEKTKLEDEFTETYNLLVESYRTDMPKLHADIIFISREISDLLVEYIPAFAAFMSIPSKMRRGESPLLPEPGLLDIGSRIQQAITNELQNLRI